MTATTTPARTLERCDHIEPDNSWSKGRRCLRVKGHQSAHRLADDDMSSLWDGFNAMKERADAANQIVAADWHEIKDLRAASRASPEEGRAALEALAIEWERKAAIYDDPAREGMEALFRGAIKTAFAECAADLRASLRSPAPTETRPAPPTEDEGAREP